MTAQLAVRSVLLQVVVLLLLPAFSLAFSAVPPSLQRLTKSPAAPQTFLFSGQFSEQQQLQEQQQQHQTQHALPLRAATALPKRKKKRKKKTVKNKSSTTPSRGPISEQELADHVSSLYIHGPGGVLRETERRRQRRRQEFDMRQRQVAAYTSEQQLQNQEAGFSSMASNLHKEERQFKSVRNLDRRPALLLNADFQPMSYLPLSLWNWQDAVKAIFSGKVTVVDVYPDVTIRAANIEVPLPSVIALTEYVPQYHQTPAFTKRNVFLRDEYRCQYCNDLFHTRDLSLDHVVPRCKGGGLHWENAVTSCRKCNGRKGSTDLKDIRSLGMKLLRAPRTPTQYELAATASRMLPRRVHPTWEPYLGVLKTSKKAIAAPDCGAGAIPSSTEEAALTNKRATPKGP